TTSRVLLVSEVFPPQKGGSGRWLWELYRRLQGAAVTVAAAAGSDTAGFDASSPMPILRLPLRLSTWGLASGAGLREYWRAFRELDAAVRRTSPDAVHCAKCLPEG